MTVSSLHLHLQLIRLMLWVWISNWLRDSQSIRFKNILAPFCTGLSDLSGGWLVDWLTQSVGWVTGRIMNSDWLGTGYCIHRVVLTTVAVRYSSYHELQGTVWCWTPHFFDFSLVRKLPAGGKKYLTVRIQISKNLECCQISSDWWEPYSPYTNLCWSSCGAIPSSIMPNKSTS